jgi:beta-phosphoglucomutase family hydrolase
VIEAVLWDLDGVLVDTAPVHFLAWRELMAALGRELSEDEFRRGFGLRNDAILRSLLGELPEERVDELSRRKEAMFRDQIRGNVAPIGGAVPLLARLREAGKRTAIVSSTPRENIDVLLHSLGLKVAFDAIVAAEDVTRGKPDPEGYLLAAKSLGVEPQGCVVIEDAPGGVEAAKRAGMKCIGLAAARAPESLARADLVVTSLEDGAVYFLLGL